MHIRRARECEAAALSALALNAKQHWGYSPGDIERWRPQLAISAHDIDSGFTFTAEMENEIVGFYQLEPAGERWKLDHLWVLPQFIRRGIGRALLSHAVVTAQLGGASSIEIEADPNAEAFYVACGAVRQAIVAAPTIENRLRVRPLLLLNVQNCAI
jgi:ribosomal protein S18 acetylase RimI-like enzyme